MVASRPDWCISAAVWAFRSWSSTARLGREPLTDAPISRQCVDLSNSTRGVWFERTAELVPPGQPAKNAGRGIFKRERHLDVWFVRDRVTCHASGRKRPSLPADLIEARSPGFQVALIGGDARRGIPGMRDPADAPWGPRDVKSSACHRPEESSEYARNCSFGPLRSNLTEGPCALADISTRLSEAMQTRNTPLRTG